MEDIEYDKIVAEANRFKHNFKRKTNGASAKLTTKDLMFYMLSRFDAIDARMDKIEKEQSNERAVVKTLCVIIPITLTIFGLVIGIIIG